MTALHAPFLLFLCIGPPDSVELSSGTTTSPAPLPSSGLTEDYDPPFESEELQLSQVLQTAVENNLDLASGAVDIEISEAQVLVALGAYDVFITAGLNGQISETPQRGSQITLATGQRTLGGSVGFRRALETGGSVELTLQAARGSQDQPIVLGDASQGVTAFSTYRVAPTLTLSHSLLQGAGLKVGKAEINKAKIATTQAEAMRQATAQQLARNIIVAYWDLLFAHRDLINKRRSVEQANRQLENTRALVSVGRQSPIDAQAVEQAVAAREAEVLTAENTLLDRSLNLRTLIGHEFAGREILGILPTTAPEVRARDVVLKDEIDQALAANPEIRQAELSMASLRIDEMVAANRRLPRLDVSGTFTPQGRSIDTLPNQNTGDPGSEGSWGEAFGNMFNDDTSQGILADWTLSGNITLTWDVQNRTPKGQHQAAKLQLNKTEIQLKAARQTVASGVIRAANTLRTAGKSIEVNDLSYELAQKNLDAERARFEAGIATNYDVLLRLDEVDAAAAGALSAEINYLKALAELQALNGEILPAYGLAPE